MKVSFPIKFRLLGNGQKVGATDRESFSVYQEGKKKALLLALHPFLHQTGQYCPAQLLWGQRLCTYRVVGLVAAQLNDSFKTKLILIAGGLQSQDLRIYHKCVGMED